MGYTHTVIHWELYSCSKISSRLVCGVKCLRKIKVASRMFEKSVSIMTFIEWPTFCCFVTNTYYPVLVARCCETLTGSPLRSFYCVIKRGSQIDLSRKERDHMIISFGKLTCMLVVCCRTFIFVLQVRIYQISSKSFKVSFDESDDFSPLTEILNLLHFATHSCSKVVKYLRLVSGFGVRHWRKRHPITVVWYVAG